MKDELFYAWLGGFWEGEGCLWARPERGRHHVELAVFQKNRTALDFIVERLGKGKVIVVNGQGRFTKDPIHGWTLHKTKDVVVIVEKMLPYIVGRKDEAAKKLSILKEELKDNTRRWGWTQEEEQVLLKNIHLSNKKIAIKLGRPIGGIRAKRIKLGLMRKLWNLRTGWLPAL